MPKKSQDSKGFKSRRKAPRSKGARPSALAADGWPDAGQTGGATERTDRLSFALWLGAMGVVLAAVGLYYALPVRDGDLFWHLVYGRSILQTGSPTVDHTLYSWTPSDNETIYCAWIGEVLLAILEKIGGLPLLFAFRYACVLMVLACIALAFARVGRWRSFWTPLVLLIVVPGLNAGAYLKPEILSMVFFALWSLAAVSTWQSAQAGRWGAVRRKVFFFPALMLVWVNTHGVFLFGLAVTGIFLGGLALDLARARSADRTRTLLALAVAGLMAAAATACTPYGLSYLRHLMDLVDQVAKGRHGGMATVKAYRSIWVVPTKTFVTLWAAMALCLAAAFVWRRRSGARLSMALLFSNLFLALLAARYVRSFYYWPALWAMTLGTCLPGPSSWPPWVRRRTVALRSLAAILLLLLFGHITHAAVLGRQAEVWFGFGIGYQNPVQEAAFLKKEKPGTRLFNTYNTGGYLLYALYPTYKVFMDPRWFPYRSWYDQYRRFAEGEIPLESFNQRFPFDVAVVDYATSPQLITAFLGSSRWKPAFYGTVAVVFVRNDTGFSADHRSHDPGRFDALRTLGQSARVFYAAQNLLDFDAADRILQVVEKRFGHRQGAAEFLANGRLLQAAYRAYQAGKASEALDLLNRARRGPATERANLLWADLTLHRCLELAASGRYESALKEAEQVLLERPDHVKALYLAGFLGYVVARKMSDGGLPRTGIPPSANDAWKARLRRALRLGPDYRLAGQARRLLAGRPLQGPLLLAD